jgi:hypothetical protein
VSRLLSTKGHAVLEADGKVVAVGRPEHLAPDADSERRYEGFIIPGLRDAHIHPVSYAAALTGITLGHIGHLAEMTSVLRAAATTLSTGVALVATRFDDAVVAERRLPTRVDLDEAVPDRPVLVHRYCGHIAMANSAALAAAGVDASTPDPEGGSLDRDEDGAPTGVLRETAIGLVSPHLEARIKPSPQQLIDAMHGLARLGITSIGAMLGLGDGPWASLGDEVEAMIEISEDLPIRVHALVIARDEVALADARSRIDAAGHRLRWIGLKLFADGSLGGHTAAMHAPFADATDETGMMRLTTDDLALAGAALDLGGMVAIHAIGDRANTAVLDFFETIVASGVNPRRLRLEHASVLTAKDLQRIGRLGIIASVQPAFIGSETTWLGERVGEDRLPLTYPFASLLAAGATLAGGSDSPVESPDPFGGMALARDRAGLVVEESLDAASALGLFTDGGSLALGEPPPLAVGSPADLVVVDRDPLQATADELRNTEVLATIVNGEEVSVDRSQPVWV